MLKRPFFAVLTLAAITLTAPGLSGSAYAQRLPAINNPNCTAGAACNPGGGGETSTYKCSTELGYLRRVYEEELDLVEEQDHVAIVPVCTTEEFGMMRSDGNAGALRQIIADNDATMAALEAKAFTPDDVVAVRMTGEDKVILYVHPFNHM
jgi:hypothetical protein